MTPSTRWKLVHALFMAVLFYPFLGWSQGLQGPLPEGEGMEEVLQGCTACHGLSNITDPHKEFTAEEWEFYVYDMISRGAPVPEEDIDIIKDYLIENFAVD